ncbi:MAG TPA: LacI family transcriptional regulator [Ruminococcaceae bacterium]|jgi:LacI family transcriptional regulator|nr:LacI family transcriptional regulator [Oscillospiraceae bacterium]HCM24431.1 LacI family transcriptional regulator [Oscillospiraceae bacterium]
MMVTIKQMAEIIGVSPTTVSNVIHGNTKEVSAVTVEKVRQVLQKYHYIPNMTARNLASNTTHIIGIILCFAKGSSAEALKDPFNGELVGTIASTLKERQLYSMLHITNDENEAIELALSWNVDGLIICNMHEDSWSRIEKATHKPIVFIDTYFDGKRKNYANIGLQDRKGGYEMTSYLIAHGHRQIAYVSDNLVDVDLERFLGYKAALEEHHIPYQENWYIPCSHSDPALAPAELLSRRQEFTAAFFASDYYAMLAINYLQDHGVRIPEDLSVGGFDDNILAKNSRPALTTIHQSPTEKGQKAVSLLIDIMQGHPPKQQNIHLPVRLVERGSVQTVHNA